MLNRNSEFAIMPVPNRRQILYPNWNFSPGPEFPVAPFAARDFHRPQMAVLLKVPRTAGLLELRRLTKSLTATRSSPSESGPGDEIWQYNCQ